MKPEKKRTISKTKKKRKSKITWMGSEQKRQISQSMQWFS